MATYAWHWLPNGLTIFRLLAGLAFPWVREDARFAVLLVAGSTDLVDGWLGRQLGATSNFGQIADPIADKVLVLAALGCAIASDWLTWPQLFGLAARDLWVLALSALAVARGRENWFKLKPRISGKLTTAVQVAALLCVFWTRQQQAELAWLAAATSVVSACDYSYAAWRAARDKKAD